jgi:ankyrin repeat protein
MSTSSNQEAIKEYERARDLLFKENKQAVDAVFNNTVSKMEMIFKTGGIKQVAIDELIFQVRNVEMMKQFLRYGGNMHQIGPPLHPHQHSLLLNYTAAFSQYIDSIEKRELVKLIKLLIEEGAELNAVDKLGATPFMNCAIGGEKELCKFLVAQGANPSAKRNNGGTALHGAAERGHPKIFRYLVEDCGLDIEAESKDENMQPRTPLFLAALHGNIEVCGFLLETGAKVDGGEGLQPLFVAAEVNFFSNFSSMVTRKLFSFSWIMEQILCCRIPLESVPFSCAVKKAV